MNQNPHRILPPPDWDRWKTWHKLSLLVLVLTCTIGTWMMFYVIDWRVG